MMTEQSEWAVGLTFRSYSEFQSAWNKYLTTTGTSFFKYCCKQVTSWNKKIKDPSNHYNEDLVYKRLVLKCSCSGIYRSVSSGKRPHQKSLKQDCQAFIALTASNEDGNLHVKELNLEHNHTVAPLDPVVPANRRLNPELATEVQELVRYGMPVHRTVDMLREKYSKPVTTRDIWNLAARTKQSGSDEDDLKELFHEISQKDPAFSYHVIADQSSQEVKVLFFQTSHMRGQLAKYPHTLFVDGTYCTNRYGMPLYCFLVADGERHGQPVGYAIVRDEAGTTVRDVIQAFKDMNEGVVDNIKHVMLDKDCREISAVETLLPAAKISICRFHVLQILDRQVSSKGKDVKERDLLREVLQRMVYAKDETCYISGLLELQKIGGQFCTYFMANWDTIRPLWVAYLMQDNYGHYTNNVTERHNRAIKSVIKSTASISDLVRGILLLEDRAKQTLTHVKRAMTGKVTATVVRDASVPKGVVDNIHKICTPSMARMLQIELESSCSGKLVLTDEGNVSVLGEDGKIKDTVNATADSCGCLFYNSYQVPCRHMLLKRANDGVVMFSVEDVPQQWLLSHYLTDIIATAGTRTFEVAPIQTQVKKTKQQKYKTAMELFSRFANFMSFLGQSDFTQKLTHLEVLLGDWQCGKDVGNVVDTGDSGSGDQGTVGDEVVDDQDQFSRVVSDAITDVIVCESDSAVEVGDLNQCSHVFSDIGPDVIVSETDNTVQFDDVGVAGGEQDIGIASDGKVDCDLGLSGSVDISSVVDVALADHEYCVSSGSVSLPVQEVSVGFIKFPRNIRMCGRPKGAAKTVIGCQKSRRVQPSSVSLDEMNILKPVLLPGVGTVSIANGRKINRKMLRHVPDLDFGAVRVTDDFRSHFTKDGWAALKEGVEAVKQLLQICPVCSTTDDVSWSLICHICARHYHHRCLGVPFIATDNNRWLCPSCSQC